MATSANWIRLPETKPATEWLLGGPVQKMSPKTRHARAQALLVAAIDGWGGERGFALTEWHVYPAMPGEPHRPLVPDVAYITHESMQRLSPHEREEPPISPEIVAEVRSPDDRQKSIDHKVEVYLATGAKLVLNVDPIGRTVVAHSADGARDYADRTVFEHSAMPGFKLDLGAFFEQVNSHQR